MGGLPEAWSLKSGACSHAGIPGWSLALTGSMRRARLLAAALAGLLLAAGVVGMLRLRAQDPLAALPRDPAGAVAVVEERRERWQGRTLLHVGLEGPTVGRIRFVVSLPDPIPHERVPVVVVLGGLRGGSRSLREISDVLGDPGPNAIVGFDWPLPQRVPEGLELARRVPELRGQVLSVPGQVDALLSWATRQPWADRGRVSLLGFSLGALVGPAAQRLVEARGGVVAWTVVAYGGAPIGDVIAGHPKVRPAWLRPVLGAAADLLLHPIEPSEHLPHLHGRFLVMGARSDQLIARGAAERMQALAPHPRTVLLVEGDHMGVGPERLKLLAKVIALSRGWLVEQGAIDPVVQPAPAALR